MTTEAPFGSPPAPFGSSPDSYADPAPRPAFLPPDAHPASHHPAEPAATPYPPAAPAPAQFPSTGYQTAGYHTGEHRSAGYQTAGYHTGEHRSAGYPAVDAYRPGEPSAVSYGPPPAQHATPYGQPTESYVQTAETHRQPDAAYGTATTAPYAPTDAPFEAAAPFAPPGSFPASVPFPAATPFPAAGQPTPGYPTMAPGQPAPGYPAASGHPAPGYPAMPPGQLAPGHPTGAPGYPAMPPGYPPAYGAPGQGPAPAFEFAPTTKAPGVLLVVLVSMVSGLIGAFVAYHRANKARALGYPTRKYWVAFWITWPLAVSTVLGLRFVLDSTPDMTSESLARKIVNEGRFSDGTEKTTASQAICAAESVDSEGYGRYQCEIKFVNGKRESTTVVVDRAGHWVLA